MSATVLVPKAASLDELLAAADRLAAETGGDVSIHYRRDGSAELTPAAPGRRPATKPYAWGGVRRAS